MSIDGSPDKTLAILSGPVPWVLYFSFRRLYGGEEMAFNRILPVGCPGEVFARTTETMQTSVKAATQAGFEQTHIVSTAGTF